MLFALKLLYNIIEDTNLLYGWGTETFEVNGPLNSPQIVGILENVYASQIKIILHKYI